ncbi:MULTISPECIES: MarR family winged helix-turn-helix transcriptional regulator [unclassified Variovorax]|uniref:MarR family winged helix-turn-helix transcriptional regulator n=1 Tax=unclassified Variovorax TaxID=663243 RepID=UPI002108F24C|nr:MULTISPECIES: MarR family transcriptional regulator [unclassified Variovorax]
MPPAKSVKKTSPPPANVAMSEHLQQELRDAPGHLFRRGQQICISAFYSALGPDITPLQYGILRVVDKHPGLDQVTLARLLDLDNATTAEIATRLERKGLLRRELQVVLRRQRLLYLTDEGQGAIGSLQRGVEKLNAGLLAKLEPQERVDLMRLLRRFIEVHGNGDTEPLGAGSGSPIKAPVVKKAVRSRAK